MSIGRIRNTFLRRVALVIYLPAFVSLAAAIALIMWLQDLYTVTADGVRATIPEISDCWRLFRRAWQRADA